MNVEGRNEEEEAEDGQKVHTGIRFADVAA